MRRSPNLTFEPAALDRDIGLRLREARLARGISQIQLAKRIGLSFQQIQKYERGANRVAASTLMQLAGALGVSALWLLEGTSGLLEEEDSLLQLASQLPIPIYRIDAAGFIVYFNEASVAFAGRRPRVGVDRWCVSWRLYTEDGRFLAHEDCPMAVALREDRAIRGASAIAERPDGSRARFTPYPTPLHDAHGRLAGAVNMLQVMQ